MIIFLHGIQTSQPASTFSAMCKLELPIVAWPAWSYCTSWIYFINLFPYQKKTEYNVPSCLFFSHVVFPWCLWFYSMNCFCFQTSRFCSAILHTRSQSLSFSTSLVWSPKLYCSETYVDNLGFRNVSSTSAFETSKLMSLFIKHLQPISMIVWICFLDSFGKLIRATSIDFLISI